MFLCTLSVIVSLILANSNAQQKKFEAIESSMTRIRYNVPQEIRNQVPKNFAVLNLRKSRLKHQRDKNTSLHRPKIENRSKVQNNQPNRINAMRNSHKLSKNGKLSGQTRKKPIDKSGSFKKSSKLRINSFSGKYMNNKRPIVSSTEIIVDSTKISTIESQSIVRPEDRENSLININKAINSLPEQRVTVVKDDIDCNDDPTKNLENVRGPPCSFYKKLPGTNGHSFWMKNAFPHNWGDFTE